MVAGPRTGAKTDDDEDGGDEEDDEDGEDGEDGDDPPHGWTNHSMVSGGGQGSRLLLRWPSARAPSCGECGVNVKTSTATWTTATSL